jgi:hypothetical protein
MAVQKWCIQTSLLTLSAWFRQVYFPFIKVFFFLIIYSWENAEELPFCQLDNFVFSNLIVELFSVLLSLWKYI